MFLQSKKVKEWKKKNYAITILNFLIHFIILMGIIFGLMLINAKGWSNLMAYFKDGKNVNAIIYLIIFSVMLITTLYLYLYCEFRDFLMYSKNITLLFIIIEFSFVLTLVLGNYVGFYARPVALCSLLVLMLINKRQAILVNFIFGIFVFLVDSLTNQPLTEVEALISLAINTTISIFAIYFINGIDSRIKIFAMGLLMSVPIIIIGILIEVTNSFDIGRILYAVIKGLTGGMSSVIILMAALPIFEWTFNVLTNFRLVEITDHKSKLMQILARNAPGTFQHCRNVASIAESCAAAIGEDVLLARAAAYYHDIGKLKQPSYFTENQKDSYDPHKALTAELSAAIICAHTRDGYELIKKYHLPLILADVALEHHGTLLIKYFYNVALNYADGENVKEEKFRYPGPKPSTKIAAIIMLADGCEAAVKSTKDNSRETVERVVKNIISDRMAENQFTDCDITIREIAIIQEAIISALSGIYHDRISYPDLKKKDVNIFAGNEKDKRENKNA